MSTLIPSDELALPDVAHAMSCDGWVIDSVDLYRLRAHRRVSQFVESVGAESWFNDGYLTIERRDGSDTISFRLCFWRVFAMSLGPASPVFLVWRHGLAPIVCFAFVIAVSAAFYLWYAKPIERAVQRALKSGKWDIF